MKEKLINVFKIIEESWEQQVGFLQQLICYNSTLFNEAEAQYHLKNELVRMGLLVDVFDIDTSRICMMSGYAANEWGYQGRPQVVGLLKSTKTGGRSLVLNGHIDVVPIGTKRFWNYDPWGGAIEGDRLYGRGAADMKGGLTAIIYAVKAIQKAGLNLAGDVIIQSVTDEECGGNGTLACLARGYIGDACLVPEPLADGIILGTGGIMWMKTIVSGKPGHPMAGNKSVNAIDNAVFIMQALRQLEEKWNKNPHPLYKNVEHPINFVFSGMKSGEWASLPPDECIFDTRIGFSPSMTSHEAKEQVEKHLKEYVQQSPYLKENPPEIKWSIAAEGCIVEQDNNFIKAIAAAHQAVSGEFPQYNYISGSADHRFWPINYGLPAACYGPTGGNYHSHDEYINLSSLLRTTKVIAQFILDWCGVKE